jgi:hypothetical protein
MGHFFKFKSAVQLVLPQQAKNKVRGFSPPADYTDQATAACRRS